MAHMGYRVGKSGVPKLQRRKILADVFERERLPPVQDRDYMNEWGTARSSARLKKMADSIASFARNFKRNDFDRYRQAISDYGEDLDWLKQKYYTGQFRFQWPSTDL